MWHTLKFPTSDLKFRNTRNPFGEGVYKEKSSHERDIQSRLGEKKKGELFYLMPLPYALNMH